MKFVEGLTHYALVDCGRRKNSIEFTRDLTKVTCSKCIEQVEKEKRQEKEKVWGK